MALPMARHLRSFPVRRGRHPVCSFLWSPDKSLLKKQTVTFPNDFGWDVQRCFSAFGGARFPSLLGTADTKCAAHIQQRPKTSVAEDPRPLHQIDSSNFENTYLDDVESITKEVTEGQGYLCLQQLFSADDVAHARDVIYYLIRAEGKRATHFQGSNESRPDLQARTWNLLNKGMIFEKMVQHPKLLAILERILGDDLQLGSIAANTLFPGASGQEPHIDYPYWDYYEGKHWPTSPKVEAVPFHMNIQVTILLDDFTEENGASGVIPFSQRKCEYPNDPAAFYKHCVQTTGRAGDVVIFPGLIQHCAMPNKSNSSRSGLLLQYLPKYIRPMEDIKRALSADVLGRLSPRLRRLILLDYPYPAVLDEVEAVNSEGSKSEFDWK